MRSREATQYERIHHPPHYNAGDIEHCEVVEDQGWADGYYAGQVSKYLFRVGRKPGVQVLEDLRKAQWYMNRWVAWRTFGKKIWKIVRQDPEIVFRPDALAEEPRSLKEGVLWAKRTPRKVKR